MTPYWLNFIRNSLRIMPTYWRLMHSSLRINDNFLAQLMHSSLRINDNFLAQLMIRNSLRINDNLFIQLNAQIYCAL